MKSQKKYSMSFSPISDIIKRFEGVESKEKNPLSKETKALKLFSKGKDLVYVATKLDMKPEDVKRLNFLWSPNILEKSITINICN